MTTASDRSGSGVTVIAAQVPTDLADGMRKRAQASERSLSAEVRLALRAYLLDGDERDAA